MPELLALTVVKACHIELLLLPVRVTPFIANDPFRACIVVFPVVESFEKTMLPVESAKLMAPPAVDVADRVPQLVLVFPVIAPEAVRVEVPVTVAFEILRAPPVLVPVKVLAAVSDEMVNPPVVSLTVTS